ncbi:probable cytochrome P450 6a14 [Chelonus insularis]|uniref:probable cytochrome P450 6a14 n=1 Tax=Chelonus insularis TaxID=460826 RepID=UPI00158EEA04|nr:probable cytochrome P450 6a14 [Chelonus insularis]
MELITQVLIGFIIIILGVYYYLISSWKFWESKNVPGPKPTLPFGTVGDIVSGKHHIATYMKEIYETYPDEAIVGVYNVFEPIAVINNLDLIKDILIKDFSKFVDRGQEFNDYHEPLSAHLFNLEPKRWRPLRNKLTPIFTSGKLKDMFHILVECADQMERNLEKYDGKIVDMREIPARYATDVIGVCVFGLQANAIQDDNSLFRQMGRRIFDMNFKTASRILIGSFFPNVYKIMGYFLQDRVLENFIFGITKETMDYRKMNNIVKHDFVDLLMNLKNETGKLDNIELSDKLLAAQLFVFFAAGFETSSSTIGNALYELAINQSIQSELQQEIIEALNKSDGKLTYDGIKDMKYLEKVYKETLRKYPPLPFLTRRTVVPYEFAGTGIKVPANTRVWLPIYGIQRDEKYYPNPDLFDPERFSDENVKQRHDMAFLSFGNGPRNCIGARFGTIQTKVGLITILKNYQVEVCEKTDKSYDIKTRGILLAPKSGIFLKLKKVNY